MANTTKQSTKPSANMPDFLAWQVTQKGDKSYWHKLGAAWSHNDGNGFTIQLDAVPIDCRIVLRQPIEDPTVSSNDKEGA